MKESSNFKKVVISSTFATGLMIASPHFVDAALGDQTLREGMAHSDVKELQEELRARGYFTHHTSTGYYGWITAEAVQKFQRDNNLQVDGIAGRETFSALLGNVGAQTTTSSSSTVVSSSSNGLLRVGSSGAEVRSIQEVLSAKGYYTIAIDGKFGRGTEDAVRRYQRDNGLQVDGIVGPQTRSHIFNADVSYQVELPKQETTQTQTASQSSSSILRVGDSGQAVTELQAKLRSVGVFSSEPTGYYGQETRASVRQFQQIHNLAVDGIAGPNTLNKLNEVSTNQSSGNDQQLSNNTSSQSQSSSALVTNLIAEAANQIGVPYLWGGTTTRGFDCSGFIQYVFKQQGISIPRTVDLQWNAAKSVSKLQVGDIVFFETYKKGPSHNGIYIGNNQFIHSGSSTGVTVTSMSNSYWSERYLGAKRLH